MTRHDDEITTGDGVSLPLTVWEPDAGTDRRAVLHVVHGMAEHRERYGRAAERLTEAGFVVSAHDQRGHGRSLVGTPRLGVLNQGDFDAMVGDIDTIRRWLEGRYGPGDRNAGAGLPLFLLGHSMGSLLVRLRLAGLPEASGLAGAILTGPVADPGIEGSFLRNLAHLVCIVTGRDRPSRLLDGLVAGTYARSIRGRRTRFDWLSRDEREVDTYIEDPACGFVPTAGFFAELLGGAVRARNSSYAGPAAGVPLLILGGDADPVSGFGRGVERIGEKYRAAGWSEVVVRLYEGARHELLRETNREEVIADLRGWMEQKL